MSAQGLWWSGTGSSALSREPCSSSPFLSVFLFLTCICVHGVLPAPRPPRRRTGAPALPGGVLRSAQAGGPAFSSGGGVVPAHSTQGEAVAPGSTTILYGFPPRRAPVLPGARPAQVPSDWGVPERVSWGRWGWDTIPRNSFLSHAGVNLERSPARPSPAGYWTWSQPASPPTPPTTPAPAGPPAAGWPPPTCSGHSRLSGVSPCRTRILERPPPATSGLFSGCPGLRPSPCPMISYLGCAPLFFFFFPLERKPHPAAWPVVPTQPTPRWHLAFGGAQETRGGHKCIGCVSPAVTRMLAGWSPELRP